VVLPLPLSPQINTHSPGVTFKSMDFKNGASACKNLKEAFSLFIA